MRRNFIYDGGVIPFTLHLSRPPRIASPKPLNNLGERLQIHNAEEGALFAQDYFRIRGNEVRPPPRNNADVVVVYP